MTTCPRSLSPSPAYVLANLTRLLGHRAQDSLVALFLVSGRVVLTARADWGSVALDPVGAADQLVAVGRRSGAETAALLAVDLRLPDAGSGAAVPVLCENPAPGRSTEVGGWTSGRTLPALLSAWTRSGDTLLWTCEVRNERWRSPTCAADCPRDGHLCGVGATGPSRDDVLAQVTARDEAGASAIRQILDRGGQPVPGQRQSIQVSFAAAFDCRNDGDPAAAAGAILTVQDKALRDEVLRLLTGSTSDWIDCFDRWQALLRITPGECIAPVATIAGLAAWQAGDGLRASISYRIALDADPGYRLAQLLLTGLQGGLPPSAWQRCLPGAAGAAPRK